MKKQFFLFYLVSFTIYLTVGALQPAGASPHPSGRNGTHSHGVIDDWGGKQHSDQYPNRRHARSFAANLNVGEPRTVRMIYFLPNDRPYRADVVQRMKDEILNIQAFYAEQMEAHGYGRRAFRVETNAQGEPIVHRVNGRHPDSHYLDNTPRTVYDEVNDMFDFYANVYLIVIDNSINGIGLGNGAVAGGVAGETTKNGGYGLVPGAFHFTTAAHELGHAFRLEHDFRDGRYLMSYGPNDSGTDQLSACHAEFLSVHPYFNPNIPIEVGVQPTVELISPRSYPARSQRVLVRVRVSDPDGLHQVILRAHPNENRSSVKFCRGLGGKKEAVIEFDYDGVIPSAHDPAYSRNTSLLNSLVHPIIIDSVDINGNADTWVAGKREFVLFSEALQPLTKISGDNLQGLPNTPLPVPLVIELRDLNDGWGRRGVPVTFTVTAGGGSLSRLRTETDRNGRAETTLTLGPNFGENRVEVSAEGLTVTFTAVAVAPVEIPDKNLRTAIKDARDKAPGTPIAPAEIATLTHFDARRRNITDLTGLEFAANLTELRLGENNITDISPLAGLTNLTRLVLYINKISDPSPVAGLIHLTELNLAENAISDISALVNLTNLTYLELPFNSISDLSPLVANTGLGTGDEVDVRGNPLSYLSIYTHIPALQNRGVTVEFDEPLGEPVNIPDPHLRAVVENALGKVPGQPIAPAEMGILTIFDARGRNITDLTGLEFATNLKDLRLQDNNISDISGLSGLVKLKLLLLGGNSISNISVVAGLTQLTKLSLYGNNVSDISAMEPLINLTELNLSGNRLTSIASVAGLTRLTWLHLQSNSISDIAALVDLTELTALRLDRNSISDISVLSRLIQLKELRLDRNAISDLSPLVANTGLGDGDLVNVDGNPLSYTSIKTHILTLRSRGVLVHAQNLKPPTLEYLLSVPAGISLIHVPLKVTAVDSVAKTLASISDLYDALGGASMVNYLITYDTSTQAWLSYFSTADRGGAADQVLTDEMGIIAGMKAAITVRLRGNPLGTNGTSTITLNQGLNLVGLPLRDSRITRVSDLLSLDGIRGNVPTIILSDGGDFKSVGRAGDPGDITITGGQGFILTAQPAVTVTISGEGWSNVTAPAAPQILTGLPVRHTTAVLALRGSIIDEVSGVNLTGFRVAVKNLLTDRQVATTTADAEAGYRLTVVDIETMRAAGIGDVLEISAQSKSPFIGVKPLRYTVTAKDVKQSLIRLPELVAYEIPTETELLANYPNPFNPETWIPYRLAEDAFVTLTIYDGKGQVVPYAGSGASDCRGLRESVKGNLLGRQKQCR